MNCQMDLLNQVGCWFTNGLPKPNHHFRPDALEIVGRRQAPPCRRRLSGGAVRDPTGAVEVMAGSRGPMHTGARTEARITVNRD